MRCSTQKLQGTLWQANKHQPNIHQYSANRKPLSHILQLPGNFSNFNSQSCRRATFPRFTPPVALGGDWLIFEERVAYWNPVVGTEWRTWKCKGCLIFASHLSEKRPIISGSFAERDLFASRSPVIPSTGWRRCIGCFELQVSFHKRVVVLSGRSCLLKTNIGWRRCIGCDLSCRSLSTKEWLFFEAKSCLQKTNTRWRTCIRCLIFASHLSQKSPLISGSFAERDLPLKASYASSPPCSKYHRAAGGEQISFHKRATNYRALLRKMTYKDNTS